MNEILRNIILGISIAAPLGPASVAVIQNGFQGGFQRAFLTGVGITIADSTYMLIVFFGLSSVLSAPAAKVLIWAFGTIVLLYLGIQSLRESAVKVNFQAPVTKASRNPLLAGYLINLSNPLAVVWWLGIFGSILASLDTTATRLSALGHSSAILAGILFWHSSIAVLTHWGKRFLKQRTIRIVSIVAGLGLILFGLRFAYAIVKTLI